MLTTTTKVTTIANFLELGQGEGNNRQKWDSLGKWWQGGQSCFVAAAASYFLQYWLSSTAKHFVWVRPKKCSKTTASAKFSFWSCFSFLIALLQFSLICTGFQFASAFEYYLNHLDSDYPKDCCLLRKPTMSEVLLQMADLQIYDCLDFSCRGWILELSTNERPRAHLLITFQ